MESHWLYLNHMTTPTQSLWPRRMGSDWWGLSYLPTSLKGSRFALQPQDTNNGKKRQGCWAARGANLHLTNLIRKEISPRNSGMMTGQAWRGRGMCTWPSNQEEFRQVDGPPIGRDQRVMGPALCLNNFVVQLLSCVWLFPTPWTAAHQAFLSFTISQSLLKLMSIELVMPSNHLILCLPLLLPLSIFPQIRVLSSESLLCIRWPNYWSFGFSISLSNDYSGLISFRIDWFDILAVQGTLKSLIQHHSSKASILQCSTFFMAQLSHPYLTTGNTIALTIWTFAGKITALLFYTLSRFA